MSAHPLRYSTWKRFGVRYARYGSTWELRLGEWATFGQDWDDGSYAPRLQWELWLWLGKTVVKIKRPVKITR